MFYEGQDAISPIGGEGYTVEIDETLLFRRKNNVGRILSNEITKTWYFGGICRETDKIFIIPVEKRDSVTLNEAILNHILPGTRIISDCWRGYNSVQDLNYLHDKVNHSQNFIDPKDSTIHTQKIERLWKSLKQTILKQANGIEKQSYTEEFLFKINKNWHSLNIGERLELIITCLKGIEFN
jgi:hypothetical protein